VNKGLLSEDFQNLANSFGENSSAHLHERRIEVHRLDQTDSQPRNLVTEPESIGKRGTGEEESRDHQTHSNILFAD